MDSQLLHVLHLKKNSGETEMRIQVISEFLLSSPILSFGIVKAKEDYFTEEQLLTFENSVDFVPDSKSRYSRPVMTHYSRPSMLLIFGS